MYIEKYNTSKYWAVREDNHDLICVTVYKKGALEIIKRFGLTEKEMDYKSLKKYNIDNILKTLKTINTEINTLIKYLKTIKN